MSFTTLILGRIPADAMPETHLAAGPWCFVDEEMRFPEWESHFAFAPDPFAGDGGAERLEQAARQAQGLAARCLPAIAADLRPASLPPLPDAYWETLLTPWLLVACQQIVGYWWRAQALVAAYGAQSLRVPLLPQETPFTFANEHGYTFYGALGHTYVHWLYSRVLEAMWPAAWEAATTPAGAVGAAGASSASSPPPSSALATTAGGLGGRARQYLRGLMTRAALALPFPRVKGFSLRQSLVYSLALRRNTSRGDHSRTLAALAGQAPDLPFDPLPLLRASLPQSLRALRHPARIRATSRPRLRVMGIQAYEDAAYRQRCAIWRGAGHKCLCMQHGGNYGHVRTSPVVPVVEYGQHAFITWGWRSQGTQPGNFVPMPFGQLQRLRGAHKEAEPTLLFVGTEISVFPYRMDSRPTPLEYAAYRAAKHDFFEHIGRDMRARTLYRPYFTVPGTLEDAAWLLPQFPEAHLCVGPMEPRMLGCRLLVLDHHGTTLLQAFAAGVPTVLYWDRRAWALCPEAESLLDALAAAGVWYPDATGAARHVRSIWDDVAGWWQSPAVVEARERWCAAYALTIQGDTDAVWTKTLRTL